MENFLNFFKYFFKTPERTKQSFLELHVELNFVLEICIKHAL